MVQYKNISTLFELQGSFADAFQLIPNAFDTCGNLFFYMILASRITFPTSFSSFYALWQQKLYYLNSDLKVHFQKFYQEADKCSFFREIFQKTNDIEKQAFQARTLAKGEPLMTLNKLDHERQRMILLKQKDLCKVVGKTCFQKLIQ